MYDIRAVRGLTRPADIMEWYRSGHNEHDWKSCDGQKPSEGSNPSHSARKILEISRFRGFFLFVSRKPLSVRMRTLPLMFLRRSEDFASAANVVCAGHGLNIEQRPLYVSIWTTLAASSQSLKSAAFRVVVFAADADTAAKNNARIRDFSSR